VRKKKKPNQGEKPGTPVARKGENAIIEDQEPERGKDPLSMEGADLNI